MTELRTHARLAANDATTIDQDSLHDNSTRRRIRREPQLVRGIGLGSATALNMIDMIGVGPFITIPLIIIRDGRPAGDAGMDIGRAAGHLRRPGLGGTGRGHAGVGRVVSLSERNLRAAEAGAAGFFPVYLATLLQRSAFDCLGSDRAFAVRGFLLAAPGTGVVDPHLGASSSSRWELCN